MKKTTYDPTPSKLRLNIHMSPQLRRQIRIAAATQGITLRQWCVDALTRELVAKQKPK